MKSGVKQPPTIFCVNFFVESKFRFSFAVMFYVQRVFFPLNVFLQYVVPYYKRNRNMICEGSRPRGVEYLPDVATDGHLACRFQSVRGNVFLSLLCLVGNI